VILGAWLQIRQSLGPLRDLESELKAVHAGTQPRLAGRFPCARSSRWSTTSTSCSSAGDAGAEGPRPGGALAHGLKTPLTILAGEVRRLERRGEAADKIRGQIDLIGRHVDRELARTRTAGASAAAGAFTQAAPSVERLIRLMRHMPRGEALDWQNELPADLVLRVDPDDSARLSATSSTMPEVGRPAWWCAAAGMGRRPPSASSTTVPALPTTHDAASRRTATDG
jgi:hypothetical protein